MAGSGVLAQLALLPFPASPGRAAQAWWGGGCRLWCLGCRDRICARAGRGIGPRARRFWCMGCCHGNPGRGVSRRAISNRRRGGCCWCRGYWLRNHARRGRRHDWRVRHGTHGLWCLGFRRGNLVRGACGRDWVGPRRSRCLWCMGFWHRMVARGNGARGRVGARPAVGHRCMGFRHRFSTAAAGRSVGGWWCRPRGSWCMGFWHANSVFAGQRGLAAVRRGRCRRGVACVTACRGAREPGRLRRLPRFGNRHTPGCQGCHVGLPHRAILGHREAAVRADRDAEFRGAA